MSLPRGQSSGRGNAYAGKACPRPDGSPPPAKARSGLQRRKPQRDASPEVEVAEETMPVTRPARVSAAGFARATSLVEPAVAEHRRAADPDRPRTRAEARDSALSKAWKDAGLALWFPGLTDESEDEIPCPVTGDDLRAGWHPHHIVEAKTIHHHGLAARNIAVVDRRNGLIVEAVGLYHPFNLMPVSPRANLGFEDGSVSIPRALVPRWTWDFAAVLDALDPLAGPSWATERLNQDYSA